MKATKTREAAKASKTTRRERRKREDRQRRKLRLRPIGGAMDPIVLRRTIDAFSAIDLGGSWAELSPMLLPLLKRVSHPFPEEAAPIHLHVPPGVWVGFGIDVGPAWAHVSQALIDRWGVDEATLLGTALDNLRARVVEEPPRIESVSIAGTQVTVAQAQGWGSALILAPDRLGAIIGKEPRLVLTPVRNALVALSDDVDVELAVAIWEGFAEGCHDELDVDPLRWTGSALVPLAEDPSMPTPVH